MTHAGINIKTNRDEKETRLVRTSITHPLRIDDLPLGNGWLGITFCPGKKGDSVFGAAWDRDLDLDMDAIKGWGANAALSLIEDHEFEMLGVPKLGEAALLVAQPEHTVSIRSENHLSPLNKSIYPCQNRDAPPAY